MLFWLIILVSAFGGSLLLLHGFAKSKAGSERMLEAYQEMLNEVARKKVTDKASGSGDAEDQPELEVASPADTDALPELPGIGSDNTK